MPEVRRHPLTRRAFLRGTGATMALPFIEQLAPGAQPGATAKPPLRFGVFTVTGGTVLESWKPKDVGPLGKLSSILRPLEFAKDDMLVVSGLCNHGRSQGLNGPLRFLRLAMIVSATFFCAGSICSCVSCGKRSAAQAGLIKPGPIKPNAANTPANTFIGNPPGYGRQDRLQAPRRQKAGFKLGSTPGCAVAPRPVRRQYELFVRRHPCRDNSRQ